MFWLFWCLFPRPQAFISSTSSTFGLNAPFLWMSLIYLFREALVFFMTININIYNEINCKYNEDDWVYINVSVNDIVQGYCPLSAWGSSPVWQLLKLGSKRAAYESVDCEWNFDHQYYSTLVSFILCASLIYPFLTGPNRTRYGVT